MKDFNVALILSLNKRFDRKVGEGVARFIHEAGNWNIFIEDDPAAKIPDFRRGDFSGVIADLDDPRIPGRLVSLPMPVVGIGSIKPSCRLNLKNIPTIGTDNKAIAIFKGTYNPAHSWEYLQQALYKWLEPLPKPLGVLAANDARARHLLEACRRYGLRVPADVSVLGVDNDELICELAVPTLSSIIQGTEEIGYRAAQILDGLMRHCGCVQHLSARVAPVCLVERSSTDLITTDDLIVADALEYIREHACEGIGVAQVANGIEVSRSTLDNRFMAITGRSVHAEIVRVQMNMARHLLSVSDISIDKIAQRVGFCHVQYFTTVFRRHQGITPGAFRRQAR